MIAIGNKQVGPGCPVFVIAEAGINHNGNLEIARKLIHAAALAGCDAIKFQKRTVDALYTTEQLARPMESPFGTTDGDYRRGREFGFEQYQQIDQWCRESGIMWTASAWDREALDFVAGFNVPFFKIASACLTDDALLRQHRGYGNKPVILSTGMSTLVEIDHAVEVLGRDNLALLHCTSAYPSCVGELNLACIPMLAQRYGVPVGYSGHETGLATTLAAVTLGACIVERHITLDRAMWGTDQAASIEPHGLTRLVRDIRAVESAVGDGVKRVYASEVPIRAKLRRETVSR